MITRDNGFFDQLGYTENDNPNNHTLYIVLIFTSEIIIRNKNFQFSEI